MNVWKYIYIKFDKFRRWGLGKTLGEGYAAMLFVASFDVLLYFGILILIDKSVDKVLSKEYEPLYFAPLNGFATVPCVKTGPLSV